MDWATAVAIATQAADVAIKRYGCSQSDRVELVNIGAIYLYQRGVYKLGTPFNVALREMRKFNVEKRVRPDTRDMPKRSVGPAETLDLLSALASLSDDEIKLIRLVFVEDLPQEDVAKAIDRACVTVRYQMRKILEKLRDKLCYRQGDVK